MAGLKRLGHQSRITEILNEDLMLPAVAQGALGIVCRTGDDKTQEILSTLEHKPTRICVTAERTLLRALGGSCQVPIAGHATITGDRLRIRGLIASLDGKQVLLKDTEGPLSQAQEIGWDVGQKLIAAGASEILADIVQHGSEG